MADTQTIPPEAGWFTAITVALAAALRGIWPWLRSRTKEHAAKEREQAAHEQALEISRLRAEENEGKKLIRVLEAQIKELRVEVNTLRAEVNALRDAGTQDKILIATQAATIARLEEENARLRRRVLELGEEPSDAL
jgi:septal ring factor EnvC (AmiA/AmiB activator)